MNHQTQGEQIKRTAQDSQPPFNSIKESDLAAHDAVESGRTMVDKVSNAAHAVREQLGERGAEALNQAKRKAGQVYDQANKSLNEQYGKAMEYGRENPGKMTLIAFGVGVGVGVGLLVAGSHSAPHSRRQRMVEPVMNALSSIARQVFR